MTRTILASALGVLAAGCSLTLDLETKQCKSNSDCDGLTEQGETYLCTSGLCQHVACTPGGEVGTPERDKECREGHTADTDPFTTSVCEQELDGKFACLPAPCKISEACDGSDVCDKVINRCIKASETVCPGGLETECDRFDGLPICARGTCVAKECEKTEDCLNATGSPTAQCRQNKCVDPQWGCVGSPDEREAVSGKGTYRLEIADGATGQFPAGLDITLCGSFNDVLCTNPPPGAKVTLDSAKRQLIISNLPPNTQIHIWIKAPNYFSVEFYSQRTVVGETDELGVLQMFTQASLVPLLDAATGVATDEANGAIFVGRFVDCEDNGAAGVTFSTSRFRATGGGATDTKVFYMNAMNRPMAGAQETDASGLAGFVNLEATKQALLTGNVESLEVGTLTTIPQPGWMTVGHFYPRDYPTK